MILKNRQLILKCVLKDDLCSDLAEKRKRTTGPKQNKTDEAVFQWYKQNGSVGVPVRGVELQAPATSLNMFSVVLLLIRTFTHLDKDSLPVSPN
jgi:hypothetical protein